MIKKPAAVAETEKAASIAPPSETSIKKADKVVVDAVPRLGIKEKLKKAGAVPAAPKAVTVQPGDTLVRDR